jgi:hypothetical protein
MGKLDHLGDAVRSVIKAYHGSPHPSHFDRFDASYIGSGEGNQSYGFGHYAAQKQSVADDYRRTLSHRKLKEDFLEMLPEDADAAEVLEFAPHFDHRQQKFLQALNEDGWLGFDYPSQGISAALSRGAHSNWEMSPELLEAKRNLGTGYELEIQQPESALLDWDAPLHTQRAGNEEVMEKLQKDLDPSRKVDIRDLVRYGDEMPGSGLWRALSSGYREQLRGLGVGAQYSAAAQSLAEAGIPGVRYLDAGSRRAGDGTRNYVIFPGAEDSIRILRKYAIPGAVGTGVASQYGEE